MLDEQLLPDGVSVTNADCDADPESVTDPDADALNRGLEELVADGASVREAEEDDELVMKAEFDLDAVTVMVTRADPVKTADRVLVADMDCVLLVVAVLALLPEEVSEGRKLVDDALDVDVLDVENVAHEVPEKVGDVDDDADRDCAFDAVDTGVSEAVPKSELLGVADCVELAVGETVLEAVSGPMVAGPGVTVGVKVTVGSVVAVGENALEADNDTVYVPPLGDKVLVQLLTGDDVPENVDVGEELVEMLGVIDPVDETVEVCERLVLPLEHAVELTVAELVGEEDGKEGLALVVSVPL